VVVAARVSPHLAVAAFAVLVPALAYLLPTAIGDAMVYEYAIAVVVGASVLALASLASAIAFGDAQLDDPLVQSFRCERAPVRGGARRGRG
jgi:hypothetical protein